MTKEIIPILKEAAARLEAFDLGSSLQLYRKALSMAPNNGAAMLGLAMALNRVGQSVEALPLLRKLWAAMSASKTKFGPPQMATVLAQIGLAHEQLGNITEAIESYRQAGRTLPSPELQARIKQLEPLSSCTAPVQQLIMTGRRQRTAGQLDQAEKTFRAALQLHPDGPEVLHGLALVLRQQGNGAAALPLLQKATMIAPDRAEFFNDLGLVFQDRGDFSKAASFHRRALKSDPGFVSAYVNLGVACKRMGQLAESAAAYRQAIELNPKSAEAHNNLGNLLRVMGQQAQAREHLAQALSLKPDYADARQNLQAVDDAIAQAAIGGAGSEKAATNKAAAKSDKSAPKPSKPAAPVKRAASAKTKAPAKKVPRKAHSVKSAKTAAKK